MQLAIWLEIQLKIIYIYIYIYILYIYIYIYIYIALSEKYSKLLVFSDDCDNIIMDYQRIIC